MRRRNWSFAIALAGAGLLLGTAARAQDRDDRDRHMDGRHMDDHRRFDDRDRDALRDWYHDHADQLEPPRGGERWNNEDLEHRLQIDSTIDPGMKRWARPVPPNLYDRLGRIPRDWQYLMVGYNVVIVDDGWRIRDVFHFDEFSDRDRQAIHDWNRDHPDALKGILGGFGVHIDNGDLDRRLQVGLVVDPDLRGKSRPAPGELASRLSPAPRGWQYVIVGDRLCLVDRDWRIHESFHFER